MTTNNSNRIQNFEELSAALGNLTANQIFHLAQLGKKVLNINGTVLAPQILSVVTNALLNEEDEQNRTTYLFILQVAQAIAELNAEKLTERKTLEELTGVTIESEMYGTK